MLSDQVFTLKYEDLCQSPVEQLRKLFAFLDLKWTTSLGKLAQKTFHTQSIGRWKQYQEFIDTNAENMDTVFQSMDRELRITGYL